MGGLLQEGGKRAYKKGGGAPCLHGMGGELNFEIKLSSKPNVNFANYNEANTHACRAYFSLLMIGISAGINSYFL